MRARLLPCLLLLSSACAGEKSSVPPFPLQPEPLAIWNSSQRPLEEVRVHAGTEYVGAANQLTAPLADDGRAEVQIHFGEHVTVIRRNVDGGQQIAFTTAVGLDISGPGFVLQVFQESFRLHAPEPDDGPPSDGGDGGSRGDGDGDDASWGDGDGGETALDGGDPAPADSDGGDS